MSDTKTVHHGPGLATLLGVTFIVLKLTGVITWPWIWVLSPFWIGAALVMVLLALLGVGLLFANKKGWLD